MVVGLTYKHIRCKDVAIKVLRRFYVKEKNGWALNIQWINIVNPSNPFIIEKDHVFVKREDVNNWEEYNASV